MASEEELFASVDALLEQSRSSRRPQSGPGCARWPASPKPASRLR